MKLPVANAKTTASGWQAFTDGGTAPRWVTAARIVMIVAFAATIPTILNVRHGNRIVWTICIAALPFFWMTIGYHVWRRICPLAVMGQLGRFFGKPGARKMGDWMTKNYLLVQLVLMVACLSLRLVATNGSDVWLAAFFGIVIVAAIVTSFVYAGKTWCNFLCPVGMVEKLYTEPSRSASEATPMTSQCSPCVACKRHCPDIDLEQGYWKEVGGDQAAARRIAYFSWPGIVVGFYAYYYLVSGTWSYYFTGAWTYERALPDQMLAPGFTFAPMIPRVIAAPLTLIVFGAASYVVLSAIEKIIARRRIAQLDNGEARTAAIARVHHGMLAFAGLVAFNAFYAFAGQPSLQRLPSWLVSAWGVIVVFASTAMFVRRLARREDAYVQEKFAQKILKKWEWGDAPPSDDLKDIYLLHTERTKQREARLRAYKETVREMVADGLVTRNELVLLDSLRAQLGISDKDHQKIIGELSAEERQLFDPAYQGSVEQRVARERYRADLERLVMEAARQGSAPAQSTLAQLAAERGIKDAEAADALARVLAPDGPIGALYTQELAQIADLVAAAEAAAKDNDGSTESASLALLRHLAIRRAHEHAIHALGVLSVLTKRAELDHVLHAAKQRGIVKPAQLAELAEIDLVKPLAEQLAKLERGERAALTDAPILAVIGDSSRHLRAAAAVLLTRFDTDASRDALRALIDDPEGIVREAAVRAMGAKSRLTRDVLSKVLDDPDPGVRQAAVRAVSGGSTSNELPAIDPAILAQTTKGIGKPGVYATLDANAAMASLTRIEKMMLIRQVPIFAQLDADDLEELATIVEERRIEPGRDLFREGESGDAVYLIVKGQIRVYVGGTNGTPETMLAELGPGACIGEMAVLDASPRSASVRALERTRALRVPGEGFKRLLGERPEMSEAIVAELVRRMRGLVAQHAGPHARSSISIPIQPS
ncbi:MAG TPA: cyclic nucleotide-binding domain-containing protein [Kofleriaceae bacterium]